LLVEGNLDAELLDAVFAGRPVLEAAKASKNALAPRVRTERQREKPGVYYLRDRDFDYDPPDSALSPAVDQVDKEDYDKVLGWRWCRHEIENYMLEPGIVAKALKVPQDQYAEALLDAARRTRHYEAARWSVGMARRQLPPLYRLETRPEVAANKEFFLPDDLGEDDARNWAVDHVAKFREGIAPHLADEQVAANFAARQALLSDEAVASVPQVLLWFSGKDLLAALRPWLRANGLGGPGEARRDVRDWMTTHADDALSALEEWRGLKDCLAAVP